MQALTGSNVQLPLGMVTPVAVDDDNQIIYGHARTEAARLAGLDAVPVVRLGHLSSEERRA